MQGEADVLVVHGPARLVDCSSVPCDQVRVRLPAPVGAKFKETLGTINRAL